MDMELEVRVSCPDDEDAASQPVGKRDVHWAGGERGMRCLRITPFVPAEFWVEVHFTHEVDGDAVAALVEGFWRPRPLWPGSLRLVHDWWRTAGLLIMGCLFLAGPLGISPLLGPAGFCAFALYVAAVLTVEVIDHQRDRSPRGPADT